MTVETYGFSHIQLAVRDLERSIRFYTRVFGMTELRRFGTKAIMMRTPGSHEVFTLNSDPETAAQAGTMGGIAHFGFRLRAPTDMAAVLQEVREAGGEPLDHGKRSGDELWAFFKDPDGYECEIFWAPD